MAIYQGLMPQSGGISIYESAVSQGYEGTISQFWIIMNNIKNLSDRADSLKNKLTFLDSFDFMSALAE